MKKIIILNLILLSMPVFAFNIFKPKAGSLTGYSTPISKDVYKDLNIDPNDKYQRLKSPNVMTDLFSMPQVNYDLNNSNGFKRSGVEGTGAKTGVTIIYD